MHRLGRVSVRHLRWRWALKLRSCLSERSKMREGRSDELWFKVRSRTAGRGSTRVPELNETEKG